MFESHKLKISILVMDSLNFMFSLGGSILYFESYPLSRQSAEKLVTQVYIIPAFAVYFGTLFILIRMVIFSLLFIAAPDSINYNYNYDDEDEPEK